MRVDSLSKDSIGRIRDHAYAFLDRHGGPWRPVDVEHFATMEGLTRVRRGLDPGIEACLVPQVGGWVILTATDPSSPINTSPRRRRFTIGHELGHFWLPSHKGRPFYCRSSDIEALFGETRLQEREANHFSAEVLMPADLFEKDMAALDERGLYAAVDVLSSREYYNTSRLATLLRYAELTCRPLMVAVYDLRYGPSKQLAWWRPSEGWNGHHITRGHEPPAGLPRSSCGWAIARIDDEGKPFQREYSAAAQGTDWLPLMPAGLVLEECARWLWESRILVTLALQEIDL